MFISIFMILNYRKMQEKFVQAGKCIFVFVENEML